MNRDGRIGIYGGTFDPVHNTHLKIARAALKQGRVDGVLFVVAASPPHKRDEVMTNAVDRLAMVEAALEEEEYMSASRVELDREGPSYTVDTLITLRTEYPKADFFLIVGSDSLQDLPKWRQPETILQYARILVVPRPQVPAHIPPLLVGHCDLLSFEECDTSSTAIREQLIRGENVDDLIPGAVQRVIRERGLYCASCEKPAF